MTTVTISRDFGSEGDFLARKLANILGYHFVDKETIGNLLNNYGFVEFDREYESLLGFWAKFDAQRGKRRELMVEMLNKVLEAVAVHGNVVILGRSGILCSRGICRCLPCTIAGSLPIACKASYERREPDAY